jgi:hypothetical protein
LLYYREETALLLSGVDFFPFGFAAKQPKQVKLLFAGFAIGIF